MLHLRPVLLPCHAESSFALKAATAVPEAPATVGSVQASTVEEAEALDCGSVVETLLCCTVAQRTTHIPGLVMPPEKISMSSSCDHAAGPQDSLFVQTQDQAHSIESAVITACAQSMVYTVQFLLNTTHAVLLDEVLCTESMNCQRYVAVQASFAWCSLRCSPKRRSFLTGRTSLIMSPRQVSSVQCCTPAQA